MSDISLNPTNSQSGFQESLFMMTEYFSWVNTVTKKRGEKRSGNRADHVCTHGHMIHM